MRKLIKTLLVLPLGLGFFWLVVMKVVFRIAAGFGVAGPCPSALSWLVDNPIRHNAVPRLLDRVGIPVDAVPPEMQEVRVFDVWQGWLYCLEFRKPAEKTHTET